MNIKQILVVLLIHTFYVYKPSILVCGADLFPYKNKEIGTIPIDIDSDDIYMRIWEENLHENGGTEEEYNECIYIGANLDCDNLKCAELNMSNKYTDNTYKICDFEVFKQKELRIPTFIDSDLPLCRVYNLKDVPGIRDKSTGNASFMSVCKCITSSNMNLKLFSPQMKTNGRGWKLDIIENSRMIPKIYPSSRYIINVRVLTNPGWDFEFILMYKNMDFKLNQYSRSVISFKKDPNCYGFPEDESLNVLQSFNFVKDDNFVYQKFSWKSRNIRDGNQKLNLKNPVNEFATTHYYICYYNHYNAKSGYNLGSIYFRLDPKDAAKTFSLLLCLVSLVPMLIFFAYVIINSKYKVNINKLQGFILLENRSHVSSHFTLLML